MKRISLDCLGNSSPLHWLWCLLLCAFCCVAAPAQATQTVMFGVADLRDRDLATEAVELQGQWAFYWQRQLSPAAYVRGAVRPDAMMPVPGYWNSPFEPSFPTQGTATYQVTLLLPEQRPDRIALKIMSINYAYRVFVDDLLLVKGGQFSADEGGFQTSGQPGIFSFEPKRDRIDILIQVENSHLMRPGLWTPIHVGGLEPLLNLRLQKMSLDMILLGAMLAMAAYHLGLVFTRKRSPALLYFALLIFSVAAITAVSGENFLSQFFPGSDRELAYVLFHLGWYTGVCWLYLFVDAMYPGIMPAWSRKLVIAVAITSAITVIAMPSYGYMRVYDVYALYTLLGAGAVWAMLFVAARRRLDGAWLFLGGYSVFLVGICNDILHTYGVTTPAFWVPTCFLIFLAVQALLLARQYSRSFHRIEELKGELQCKADELEVRVAMRTAELQEASALVERASHAKSDFLATMSHEIRTPINGMTGMLQLLRDAPLPPLEKHYLRTMDASTRALTGIINDILDFSAIEAGKLQVEEEDFCLQELIEECISMFGGNIVESGVDFNVSVFPGLPERIVSDPVRVRQILVNLLTNAFKFTREGGVTLAVSVDGGERPGLLRFEVTDTGIGIPEDKQSQLFNSFEQLDAGTTRRYGGTGLGLAISRKLAEMLGGEIGFYSMPGRGSCFWFTIAVGVSTPPTSYLWLREQRERLRVIVADSHPFRAAALIQQFLALNVAVTHCARKVSLEKALQRETQQQVVIIDDEFDGDGLAWLSWRRAQLADPTLIIATVRYGQGLRLRSDASLHQIMLLEKPYVPSRVVDMIMQVLQKRDTGRDAPEPVKSSRSALRPLRIAVAEDNPVNRKVMEGLLKKIGLTDLVFFENGKTLVDWMSDGQSVDLVLMDVDMPVMDGYEATRVLRELQQAGRIQPPLIIGVSAKVLEEHERLARQLGMDDYLRKPVRLEEIAAALERHACLCA